MSLHRRLVVSIVVVHVVFGTLIVALLRDRPGWAVAIEVMVILSLVGALRLAYRVLAPSRVLGEAVDLLGVGDFATRLRPTGHRELDGIIDVYNRMAGQLREERLRSVELDHLLAEIERVSPVAMIVLDHDRRVARCNPAAEQLLGLRELEVRGQRLDELDATIGRQLATAPFEHAELVPLEGRRRLRVRRVQFLDRGFARSFFLIDELTDELRRSEKAAYGKLIRMIAHEVNNTSGAVGSLLDSCTTYAPQIREADRPDFESALEVASRRIDHMNQFMQSFADVVRLARPALCPVDLLRMLADLHRLLRHELEQRHITWHRHAQAESALVEADPVQLERALLNILRNALQATGDGGNIEVAVHGAGGCTRLEIFDDGEGIDDEKARHLFTPFYTTRPDGQGIGLTLVQEILLAHGCDFSLGPHEGRTRFRIDFPGPVPRQEGADL